MKPRRSLRTQQRRFTGVTGLIAVVAVGTVLVSEWQSAERLVEETIGRTTSVTADRLERSLDETRAQLTSIAGLVPVHSMSERVCIPLAESAEVTRERDELFLASSDGQVVCSTASVPSRFDPNASWFIGATAPEAGFVPSNPVFNEGLRDYQIVLTIPVTGPSGEALGILGLRRSVWHYSALFEEEGLPAEHLLTVTHNDGTILARSRDLMEHLQRGPLPRTGNQGALFATSSGVRRSPSAEGVPYIWSYRHLAEFPWSIYTGVPEISIRSAAIAAAIPKLVFILLLFLLPLVLGDRLLRSVSSSVGVLVLWARTGEDTEPPKLALPEAEEIAEAFARTLRERDLALESEKSARGRVTTILNNAVLGIYVTTGDGRIRDANPAMGRMLGYDTYEAMIGVDVGTLYADPSARGAILDAAETGLVSSAETEWIRKDGTTFPVRLSWQQWAEDGGKGYEVIAEDLTDRRSLEEQLRRSQKLEAVGQLAGGVAHDFNNRLMVIGGEVEELLDRVGHDSEARRSLEVILESVDRSAQLTGQLLTFSRKQPHRPVVLDLNEITERIRSMAGRLLGEDIEIVVRGEAGATVRADAGQIEQVLMNLCTNARDAMPHGGRLTLASERRLVSLAEATTQIDVEPGEYVILSVTDTGEGMDEGTRERIFDPFFTTKPSGKGTGLGLATVYGIVQQSGGHMRVHSWRGRGSTFEVWLPRVVDSTERGESDLDDAVQDVTSGETVLVVEDEAPVRRVIVRMLQGAGYNVLSSEDGYAALSVLRKHGSPIDLLVSDVLMPGIKGPELALRLVRQGDIGRVLLVSGYTDGTPDLGIDDLPWAFTAKPFHRAGFLAQVRALLEQPAYRGLPSVEVEV